MELQLLLYIEMFLLTCSTLIIFFLALTYRRLSQQMSSLQQGQQKLRSQTYQKSSKVLEQARMQSLGIIEDSEHKAKEILLDTDLFTADAEKDFREGIQEILKVNSKEFVEELNALRANMSASFQETAKNLEAEAAREIDIFRKNLEAETTASKNKLLTQTTQAQQAISESLEKERQKVMAEMQSKVQEIVSEVSYQVVGKTLSKKDQETLLMNALESAKQHHVL